MSGRGLWIVALGAALAALVALDFFRAQEPGSADEGGGVAARLSSAAADEPRDEGPAAAKGAARVRVSPSPDPRADAAAADSRDAPTPPQPAPVLPPSAAPYASIAAALENHDRPPERRMQPIPEMLETERAFAAENVDPSWSTAAEAGVLAGFAAISGLSLVSLNVECRTTLCLLQFVEPQTPPPNYPNPNVAEIASSAGLKVLWRMGIRDRTGAPVAMAYLARAAEETAAGAPR